MIEKLTKTPASSKKLQLNVWWKLTACIFTVTYICQMVSLFVDEMTVVSNKDTTIKFGALSMLREGENDRIKYSGLCTKNDNQFCELERRGIAWIVFHILSWITGIIPIVAVITLGFNRSEMGLFKSEKYAFLGLKASIGIMVTYQTIAVMVWGTDSPVPVDPGFEKHTGASMGLSTATIVLYTCCTLTFCVMKA